jgi:type I restriction enzyme M protein
LNLLEAVIGLGPNLFYGTGLAACILIFSQQTGHPNKVLMVDASSLYRSGRNQNTLEPEHAQQVLTWVQTYEDVEGRAKVVSLAEIEANDWNLDIPRYVEPIIEEETITVAEALDNLQTALAEAYAAEDHLKQLLTNAGLMPAGEIE